VQLPYCLGTTLPLGLVGPGFSRTMPPATCRSFRICPVLYMSKWFSSFDRNAFLSKPTVLTGSLLERTSAMPVAMSEAGLRDVTVGVKARDNAQLLAGVDDAVVPSEGKF